MIIFLSLLFWLLSPTPAHALTLYNQNIFGYPVNNISSRLDTIARFINQTQPDIVTLQEVFFPSHLKRFPTSYQAYYTRRGPLIRGGLVVLIKQSIPVNNHSYSSFSNQGNLISLQVVDRFLDKGYQHICIVDGYCLTNTHLTANYFGSTNYTTQLLQTAQLLSVQGDLLVGDFNFPNSSLPYKLLLSKFSSLVSHSLDHTFASQPIATTSSSQTINFSPPISDHSGLFLTLP